MANPRITVKAGEAKTIRFSIKDKFGDGVDVSTATLAFDVEDKADRTSYIFQKTDGDFDKTQAGIGLVTVPVSATDTNQDPGKYTGELKITFSASNIDKSVDIDFVIERSVTA